MRKIFLSLLFVAISVSAVIAQNTPKHIKLNIEEFAYKPSKAGKALTILSVVTDPKKALWIPDKSMVPQMNEAVVSGAVDIPWVEKADAGAADYTLKGHFTQTEIATGSDEAVIVRARSFIIDNKTGKEVATKVVQGTSMTFISFQNTATIKASAAKSFAHFMKRFILEALPVTGHILEKGVEQTDGKIKEKQCYVDLGSLHGLEPGMMLYVTENGKYKAELRVVEVLGDDICACKVVKGDSYVTKSLEKGVEMVVTSRPKKIDTLL